jgi:predicted amidohydrolase YtcJ
MSTKTGIENNRQADLIVMNGRLATQDERRSFASAAAIKDGRFVAVGSDQDVMPYRGALSKVIDLKGRTVIPGLNDSHTHPIRGGLNYNMELRWDGVPSLADALRMLKEQARRTPAPQWVRVVGGWSEFQFKERRLSTLDEINHAAPDTPVFILHLYAQAMLNSAALRAVGYTKDTPDPPGGVIQRDKRGNPTGLLVAKPNRADQSNRIRADDRRGQGGLCVGGIRPARAAGAASESGLVAGGEVRRLRQSRNQLCYACHAPSFARTWRTDMAAPSIRGRAACAVG